MKKASYIIVSVISIMIINNLVHSIYNLSQKKNLVTETQEELKKEQDRNARLTDQLTQVKREDFVEEEARNKLFMVQPGETIVVLPTPTQEEGNSTETVKNLPIWKQWLQTFFSSTS